MKASSRILIAITSIVMAMALLPAVAYAGSGQLIGAEIMADDSSTTSSEYEGHATLNLIQSGDYHPTEKAAGLFSKRSSSWLSAEQEAALRDRLTVGLVNRENVIDVGDLGIEASDETELSTVIQIIGSDVVNSNPDLFYVWSSVGFRYQRWEVRDVYTLTKMYPQYDADVAAFESMTAEYEREMQNVLSWVPADATKLEQVKAVHDWFVRNCAYNIEAGEMGDPGSYGSVNPWTAYGALVDHRPVCEGYALAFIAVMNRLGIPCVHVSQFSTSGDGGHAWNRIEIDGEWYNLDVTWDDPTPDLGFDDEPSTMFFLKSDQWFKNYSIENNIEFHTDWSPAGIPGTDTSFDKKVDWQTYSGPASSSSMSVTDFELPESLTLDVDESQVLAISSIAPASMDSVLTRARAVWTTSDTSVAYVDVLGKVIATGTGGTATITCTIDGVTRSCDVTVNDLLGLAAGETGGKFGSCKWVLSADGSTLTISPLRGDVGTFFDWPGPWDSYQSDITKVVFSDTVRAVGSYSNMFYGYTSLATADLSGLDTTGMVSMFGMFQGCSSLTSLDLSSFDTSNVTNMVIMFGGCTSLTSIVLDPSKFNTSNVTDMSYMFYNCPNLSSLDVSGFDTSKVEDMQLMFNYCASLGSLDVSGFDTSNVTTMKSMFYYCANVESLDVSGFDTSKVTDMSNMFSSCYNLAALDLSSFAISEETNVTGMLSYCVGLSRIKLGAGVLKLDALPEFEVNGHSDWFSSKDWEWYDSGEIVSSRLGIADTYLKSDDETVFGHDWSEWVQNAAPTCTETGVETRTCSRCGGIETREVAALGHRLTPTAANAATCEVAGNSAYWTCGRCGKHFCDEAGAVEVEEGGWVIPALGHDWDEGEVTVEPSCTEPGTRVFACSRCDATRDEVVEALGHDLVHHDARDATCIEVGWGAYDACTRCGYTTYEETPALGHDLVHHDANAATCTEVGWNAYDTCSRCDYTTYEEVPALGHKPVTDAAVAPTCTEVGLTEGSHCSACGEVLVAQEPVPALGHSWDSGEVTKASTYDAAGVRTFTCDLCGQKRTEAIPALKRISLSGATISGITSKTYTGKAIEPAPTVKVSGKTLVEGVDFTVSYKSNVSAGTATVTVTGKGAYSGSKSVTFAIAKAANTLKLAKATCTVKLSKVKKSKQVVAGAKVAVKGQGAMAYSVKKVAKAKYKKYVSINKKTGKITIKKGCPKGTFKVTVKATAEGDANYKKSAAKTAVVTIKVK